MSPMGASEAEMGGPSALAGSLAGGALILVASRSRSWPFPSAVLVGCLFACRSSSQSVAQQAAICLSRLERFFWSGSGQSRRAPQWALPSRPGKAPTMTDREDSMDDDVFEAVEARLEVPEDGQRGTHSPTGYRGYQPSIDVINLCNQLEDAEVPVHKTILLGDSGVGKTSLLVKFDTGKFESSKFSATVGIGFTTKVVQVDDSKVKLQIWDTAGQERFRCVTHAYYRDAHALLLLYDVTNKKSFDNIRAWLGEIKDYAHDDVVIMLLGNKADCGSDRAIKREEGERLAREYRVTFMETSAKSGQNVELAFHAIARDLTSRSAANADPQRFNVQDYVRAQAQHGPESPQCAACAF
uniref:small monomeric GTPase n=1 Tax=Dendroctonus ponderosae TaxID=77166 RepID=A0AAR5Q011_DENPD